MTVIVGMLCSDGVILGADSSATFGAGPAHPTIEQPVRKITVVGGQVIVAGTGQIGLGQRFVEVVKELHKKKTFEQKTPVEAGKALAAAAIKDFVTTSAPKEQYGALVAWASHGRPHLCEFGIVDMQPELKDENIWYASMGCGQPIADPFLGLMRRSFCPEAPPNLALGRFVVAWTLEHTIDVNPGGIKEPLRIAELCKVDGSYVARELEEEALAEHLASVDAAHDHLASFASRYSTGGAPEVPTPPKA